MKGMVNMNKNYMATLKSGLNKAGYIYLQDGLKLYVVRMSDGAPFGYFFKYRENERYVYLKLEGDNSGYVSETFPSQKAAAEFMRRGGY